MTGLKGVESQLGEEEDEEEEDDYDDDNSDDDEENMSKTTATFSLFNQLSDLALKSSKYMF